MTEDLKDLVHERFRRTDAKLDHMIEQFSGFAQRLGSVGQQVASLRTDFAHLREDLVIASTGSTQGWSASRTGLG